MHGKWLGISLPVEAAERWKARSPGRVEVGHCREQLAPGMVGLHLQADLQGTQAGNEGVRQDPTSICTVAPQTGGGLSEASLDSSGSAHSLFGKDSVSAFQVGPFSDRSCLGFSDTEALLGSALGLGVHAELSRGQSAWGGPPA